MTSKRYFFKLGLLNLIFVFFILQIQLRLFPLWNSNFSEQFNNGLNELIIVLSSGFLISTFFFLIVVYFPQKSIQKSTLRIITPRLNTINNALAKSIFYLGNSRIPNFENNDVILKYSEINLIDTLDNRLMNFRYEILGNRGEWIPFFTGNQTEMEHFESEQDLVRSIIDEIFDLPYSIYLDKNLLDALSELRNCGLYRSGMAYKKFKHIIKGKKISSDNFKDDFYQYYTLFYKLNKFKKATLIRANNETK